ncbi:MAG: phenylalanyl-tRNA synthetase subunit alpha [Pedobacter sp.]|nr:phenylalanyl-tRNA synthetase subunit alpha [Pedobacter sp.]MDQ8053467.1 phenylalanyl-tRNA synthetase subunit alpha [Pedobacter sp.]
MSKEVLEISVMVDEQFDVKFNWLEGALGLVLNICRQLHIK